MLISSNLHALKDFETQWAKSHGTCNRRSTPKNRINFAKLGNLLLRISLFLHCSYTYLLLLRIILQLFYRWGPNHQWGKFRIVFISFYFNIWDIVSIYSFCSLIHVLSLCSLIVPYPYLFGKFTSCANYISSGYGRCKLCHIICFVPFLSVRLLKAKYIKSWQRVND